jgi:hypothetical protein
MEPHQAQQLVHDLKDQGILPAQHIKSLLMKDIYADYELSKQARERLIQLAGIPVTNLNASTYNQATEARTQRFNAAPSEAEQELLKRITPVWEQLPETHKQMIQEAFNSLVGGNSSHVVPEPFSMQANWQSMLFGLLPGRLPLVPSIPNIGEGDLFTSTHFTAGLKAVPRLLGLVSALDAMSQDPKKIYRWFTQGTRGPNLGSPVYQVPDFEKKFPRTGKGSYVSNYCQAMACNFTNDFALAMNTLKMRNDNQINTNTLHNTDIGFTLDNGDSHDVACRINFRQDPNAPGKLTGTCTVVDSVPKHVQNTNRPGQDEAFKNLDCLIQAYFTSVLGWKKQDVPAIKSKVIYMNNQVNGYCTSMAVDHMLAKGLNQLPNKTHPTIPGWATTIQMEEGSSPSRPQRDVQGKLVANNSNNTYFMKRTLDKLVQARLILSLPEFKKLTQEKQSWMRSALGQIY